MSSILFYLFYFFTTSIYKDKKTSKKIYKKKYGKQISESSITCQQVSQMTIGCVIRMLLPCNQDQRTTQKIKEKLRLSFIEHHNQCMHSQLIGLAIIS